MLLTEKFKSAQHWLSYQLLFISMRWQRWKIAYYSWRLVISIKKHSNIYFQDKINCWVSSQGFLGLQLQWFPYKA